MGYADLTGEIEKLFAAFKLAQHVCNGRWRWKREQRGSAGARRTWFLEHDRGSLEEMAFIAAFSTRWLVEAGINPEPYINRLQKLFAEKSSTFGDLLAQMQDGEPDPLADEIYRVVTSGTEDGLVLHNKVAEVANTALHSGAGSSTWRQIMELPTHLDRVACQVSEQHSSASGAIREALLEFYHANWRELRGRVSSELITSLEEHPAA